MADNVSQVCEAMSKVKGLGERSEPQTPCYVK